jgi:hypothetical protein
MPAGAPLGTRWPDLLDEVECPHLTTLTLEVARGVRQRPYMPDDYGNLLRDKGKEHETAYLAELRARGRHVPNSPRGQPSIARFSLQGLRPSRLGGPRRGGIASAAPMVASQLLLYPSPVTGEFMLAACGG